MAPPLPAEPPPLPAEAPELPPEPLVLPDAPPFAAGAAADPAQPQTIHATKGPIGNFILFPCASVFPASTRIVAKGVETTKRLTDRCRARTFPLLSDSFRSAEGFL
jgi:hypothetical protein